MPFLYQPGDSHIMSTAMSTSTSLIAVFLTIATFQSGAAEPASGSNLYTVVDGYKVDPATMKGFRAWRAAACDRCHGANQEGLVGPSLISSLKVLSKEDFIKTVTEGRLEKGMVAFKTSKIVMDNMDNLYAYLKGRSDGAITRAKVEELKP
jgi:mono/diheme cytochrome c family protein